MGIYIHIRKRERVDMIIGGLSKRVGQMEFLCTLASAPYYENHIQRAEGWFRGTSAPHLMLVGEPYVNLATKPEERITGRTVIGFGGDAGFLTDYRWDGWPVLGYAVWDGLECAFRMYKERGNLLYPLSLEDAIDRGILDGRGRLRRCVRAPEIENELNSGYLSDSDVVC